MRNFATVSYVQILFLKKMKSMKRFYLLLMLCLITFGGFATNYYNTPSTDISTAANWNTNVSGSGGSTASDFTTSGDVFILLNSGPTQGAAISFGSGVTFYDSTSFTAGANITVNGTLIVSPGVTLDMATFQLLGTPATTINNGTILTQNTTSTPIPTGMTWGGTVNYNGSTGSQTVMAGTYNNLTINNASGATTQGDVTVNNALTLTAGNLDIGGYNLSFGSSASAVSGTFSATTMIIASGGGEVRKYGTSSSTATYTFPIGDNTGTAEYSPITLTFSGGSYAGYSSVKVINSKQPNNANTTNYLNRYWTVNQSGYSGFGCVVAATYVSADVIGTQTSILMGKWDGAIPWVRYTGSNSGYVLTSPSTTFSDFTGINSANPTVSISPSAPTICSGSSVGLTATGSGDPTLVYSWSPATGLSATTGASVTASPASTTIYSVTMTDGNGFTATSTSTVSVNSVPAAITGTTSACIGTTTGLTDATSFGAWSSSTPTVGTIGAGSGIVTQEYQQAQQRLPILYLQVVIQLLP